MMFNDLIVSGLHVNNTWVDKNEPLPPSLKSKKRRLQDKITGNYCYLPSGIEGYQILPIYIRDLFGDGIYYCRLSESHPNNFYFLIIKDGGILGTSDCIVNDIMLNYLLKEVEQSIYGDLKVIELTKDDFNEILQEYLLVKKSSSKENRRLMIIASVFFVTLLFLLLIFIVTANQIS